MDQIWRPISGSHPLYSRTGDGKSWPEEGGKGRKGEAEGGWGEEGGNGKVGYAANIRFEANICEFEANTNLYAIVCKRLLAWM